MTLSRKRILIGSCVLAGLIVIWIGWRVYVFTARSTLQVGPATTVVEGPLRDDGTFDFEAALRNLASVGVTPDNNAAVLLGSAFGPEDVPPELRERYFRYLGIAELPEVAEYYVTQNRFAQQLAESPGPTGEKYLAILDEMSVAQERPWTRAEYPQVSAWIDKNERPVELIEQASRRSHFYVPVVSGEGLMSAPLPLIQNLRDAARLLLTRAMLRMGEHDLDGAANDLLTCHRLAVLVGKGSTTIGNLVAVALDAVAVNADQVLLGQKMSIEQLERFQKVIVEQHSVTNMAATVDLYERLVALDAMQSLWRGTSALSEKNEFLRLSSIDINVALRRMNAYYDHVVATMKLKGVQDRRRALESMDATLDQQRKELFRTQNLATSLLWGSRTGVNESIADIFLQFMAPAAVQIQVAEDRNRTRRDLLRVGLGLALYRAEHATYPETLDILRPKYLKEIPVDSYIDQPLHYKRLPDGFLLYSVKEDGQDNEGQPEQGGKPGDLAFKVTHKSPEE